MNSISLGLEVHGGKVRNELAMSFNVLINSAKIQPLLKWERTGEVYLGNQDASLRELVGCHPESSLQLLHGGLPRLLVPVIEAK